MHRACARRVRGDHPPESRIFGMLCADGKEHPRWKTQFAIAAETEHKRLVDHNLVTGWVLQIHVTHCDRDVAMNLDAVLGSIVIVPDFDPALKCKARVFREVRIATHEVGNRT